MVDENGNEQWMFESYDFEKQHNAIDTFIFWYGQIANCLFWSFILFIKLLTLAPFWVESLGNSVVRGVFAIRNQSVCVL